MNTARKALHYLWLHAWKYRVIERQHRHYVRNLRQRGDKVRVVFTAIDITLWRYQHLYELMNGDDRFQCTIVLTPCPLREHLDRDLEGLRRFFDQRGINYIDFDISGKPFDIRKELNPDIIFYAQPYEYLLSSEHDCRHFYDRLVCYIPYAFWTATGKSSYDLHFHNQAWRMFYSTNMHLDDARRMATNHGRNVRVAGYPNADDYLASYHDNPWRNINDGFQRKRVIWAPHYTIMSKSTFPPRSNFLWMADLMLSLAREYSDRLQIAFKPHPALLTQLYEHPDWGEKRADNYYNEWRSMPNTQLEQGEFTNLFMNSDAMIHDSASFTVEYNYSRRPSMFVVRDMESILEGMNDFGRLAFRQQYLGSTETDIRSFIDSVVLCGNDTMLSQREQFFYDYLLPPNGKSVAENVFDDIKESLGFEN